MKDYWVRVVAESYGQAREIFIDRFSKRFMGKPDKWAFQYEENKFHSRYCPRGEYKCYIQK